MAKPPAAVPVAVPAALSATSTRRCPFCAEEILALAIKCKHCGSALVPISNRPPHAAIPATPVTIIGGGILLSAIAFVIYGGAQRLFSDVPPEGTPSPHASPSQSRPARSDLPAAQSNLCGALAQSRSAYQGLLAEKANELRLSQERSARRESLLQALPDGTFEDWSGQITSLKTNSEGKAALAVSLPCDAVLKTSGSAIGDGGRDTLIPQGSPLYEKLAALREGQRVRVAGTFFSNDQDGYFELSLTEKGSMTQPEFLVRFLDVVPEGVDSSGARNAATLPTGNGGRRPISDYCEYGRNIALRMMQAHLARDSAASEQLSDEFNAFLKDESVPPLEKVRMGECFRAAGVELGAIK